jgi:hypothetical protein
MVQQNATVLDHRVDTILEPIRYNTVNLYELSAIDRKALDGKPVINVFAGSKFVVDIPRKLFMSTSANASTLVNNDQTEIRLPEETDEEAIHYIIQWLKSTTRMNKIITPRMLNDFERAVTTCRVSAMLGLFKYVEHIADRWARHVCKTFWENELEIVENPWKCAIGGDDYFVTRVAETFAYLIRHDKLSERAFEDLPDDYPRIYAKVVQRNAGWERYTRRQQEKEVRRAEQQAHNAEIRRIRKREAEKQRINKAEDRAQEVELRPILLQKLKGNKVVALTREELEVCERLRARGDLAFF